MALENITQVQGNLKDSFKQLQPETIQHSDEITTARREDKDLRNKWFYTANHSLFKTEQKKGIWYFGRLETNPIFKNIEEAYKQLVQDSNYLPSEEARN